MYIRTVLSKEEQVALRIFRETHKPNVAEVFTHNYYDRRIVPTILHNMGFKKFFEAYYVGYDVRSDYNV